MRGVMIAAGASLLAHFDWMAYVFGAILIFTAVKLLADRHEELEPERNPLVRFVRRHMAVTDRYDGDRLLVRVNGRWAATPLLLVLLVIEVTDVLFAVDSIPAVFAITTDPFLVVTSNACAVLGLRSLYFALAPLVGRFRFIKISLVFILAFVGVKMFLVHHYPIPTVFSLAVIAGILFVGFTASVVAPEGQMMPIVSPLAGQNGTVSLVTVGAARRVVALVIGTSVVLLGIALIVLPGPAFVVIPAGLAILASEFVWAQRLLSRLKRAEAALLRSAGLRD
jgi:tellurite resistance protein TerC